MNKENKTEITRKEIANMFDSAAEKSYTCGANPASSKQVWFLSGLLIEACERDGKSTRDEMMNIYNDGPLTKSRASKSIEFFLEMK